MVLMALIFFSIFTATRTRRFSGPQTRDSRLPQEIQCPSQIKSKSTAESIFRRILFLTFLFLYRAPSWRLCWQRGTFPVTCHRFSWKQMSSFCLFQAGASSTRRATVPTSKNQPTAARQSKRTTSKVNIFLILLSLLPGRPSFSNFFHFIFMNICLGSIGHFTSWWKKQNTSSMNECSVLSCVRLITKLFFFFFLNSNYLTAG